jgi:hypothetical protein
MNNGVGFLLIQQVATGSKTKFSFDLDTQPYLGSQIYRFRLRTALNGEYFGPLIEIVLTGVER